MPPFFIALVNNSGQTAILSFSPEPENPGVDAGVFAGVV
jgi:hypothetical protein